MTDLDREWEFIYCELSGQLTIDWCERMSDDECAAIFAQIRWSATGGAAHCPRCGCSDLYAYKSRAIWKCKCCERQFSNTSGTIFSSAKMKPRQYLLAICYTLNHHVNALLMSYIMDVQYRTAHHLTTRMLSSNIRAYKEWVKCEIS